MVLRQRPGEGRQQRADRPRLLVAGRRRRAAPGRGRRPAGVPDQRQWQARRGARLEPRPGRLGPLQGGQRLGPSISPDGSKVAFVNSAGNVNDIYTVGTANPGAALATPTKITGQTSAAPNAFEHPVWTPDGKGIVFQWLDGGGHDYDTQSVSATGTGSTAYTQVVPGTRVLGLPAFQPLVRSHVVRLAGADRGDTAIKTSQSHWATAGKAGSAGAPAKAVVLSRSDQFADALGGSALAAKVGGPLLLTPTAGLAPTVQAEIQRVLGPGDGTKTVYVLGGEKALSPAVADALTKLHYVVQRVAGADRYSTAVKIAQTVTGGADKAPDYILVATGQNFPDALSAGAAAGSINARGGKTAVVLLTNDKLMPQPTADYLAPLNARTNLNADRSKPGNFIELDSVGKQAELALSSHWIPPGYQAARSPRCPARTGTTRRSRWRATSSGRPTPPAWPPA
ncbi:cell wall-binding repeat-containing protein [Catenulispora yoronensis]